MSTETSVGRCSRHYAVPHYGPMLGEHLQDGCSALALARPTKDIERLPRAPVMSRDTRRPFFHVEFASAYWSTGS